MEVSDYLQAPIALPPEKQPRFPLDRRLGGPQSRSGCHGEESIACAGDHLVIILTVLTIKKNHEDGQGIRNTRRLISVRNDAIQIASL
jgi:hypothetical protein